MLKIKLFIIYISVKSLLCGCWADKRKSDFIIADHLYKIKKIGKILNKHHEPSGLELAGDGTYLWTHDDSGGKNILYKTDFKGNTIDKVIIPNTSNIDWEDLAKDDKGNIYIGDFGNNSNKRKNLRIYKVIEKDIEMENGRWKMENGKIPAAAMDDLQISKSKDLPISKCIVDTINFYYSDQKAFPPGKKFRNYDCEAFFWQHGNLFLFSKNRGSKYVKMYMLPDKPGNYIAQLKDSIRINTMITAADISPDGKWVALLGYGKIYLFEVYTDFPKPYLNINDDIQKHYCIKIPKGGQSEALVFINNNDFVFCNEKGKLFLAVRKK